MFVDSAVINGTRTVALFHLELDEVLPQDIFYKYVILCFYSKALFDRASSRLKSLWQRQARPRVQQWKGRGWLGRMM